MVARDIQSMITRNRVIGLCATVMLLIGLGSGFIIGLSYASLSVVVLILTMALVRNVFAASAPRILFDVFALLFWAVFVWAHFDALIPERQIQEMIAGSLME